MIGFPFELLLGRTPSGDETDDDDELSIEL